jgi:hypothetical protein
MVTETTNHYDYNLWVASPGVVALSAYKYKMQNGYETTDTSSWTTLELMVNKSARDTTAIKFLLDSFNEPEVYVDLDVWNGDRSMFVTASAPAVVREFIGSLPRYSY